MLVKRRRQWIPSSETLQILESFFTGPILLKPLLDVVIVINESDTKQRIPYFMPVNMETMIKIQLESCDMVMKSLVYCFE